MVFGDDDAVAGDAVPGDKDAIAEDAALGDAGVPADGAPNAAVDDVVEADCGDARGCVA